MPDYSFHTLSPIDFENLVRDLLQFEHSIRLESFKTGKDNGIDLRYCEDDTHSIIVQAKHFAGSNFSTLLSHLRLKEKLKIEKLKPDRYILATSIPLSPSNKDKIRATLFPYIRKPGDIYGRNDLNNLLGMFPTVEKQHVKLWLSSTTVLEEVLHSRILNQTRITLQDIRDKARLYVTNQSFNNALEILKEHNYVIIAGIPGIGKTTLAKMLVLHFLHSNYDFIDVSYDISEAYTIPDYERPRVYLYDDFLGRTSLAEKLRKNEDHRLLNFISAIRTTKSAKLILTTREYILRQAQVTYEILNSPIFEKPQCIIDLSQYTRPIRAQILYNHLYFSALPKGHIEAIIQQEAYFEIIDHQNYNPRIVEYMTDPMWVGREESSKYPTVFLRNLEKPFLIWEKAFSDHLTDVAREIIIVLGTLPHEVFVEDLELAAKQFMSRHGMEISKKEFHRALAELQGSFIILKRDRGNDIVSFHSPSIQDFVENYLENNPDLFEALGNKICFFEQIQWLCERTMVNRQVYKIQSILPAQFEKALAAKPCTLVNYSRDRGRSIYKERISLDYVARLAFLASLISKSEFSFLKDIFRDALRRLSDQMIKLQTTNETILHLLKHVLTIDCVSDLKNSFIEATKEALFRNAYWISDASCITEFLELCPHISTTQSREDLVELIDNIVDNNLSVEDDIDWLREELHTLESIEEKHGLGLGQQIESIRDILSGAEENQPNVDDDYDYERFREIRDERTIENDTLTDMFSTLLR